MKNESDRLISYYQMLSLLYVSIGCIVLSAILFACSSPSAKNPLLLRADSLMETLPDSALSILESISSPEKFSGADRALYALLFTQAKHKNAIPLEDDSLIKIAVDYYGDKKKSMNAAKAHYYLGMTYQDMENVSFAVEEYLIAIQLMPKRNEFMATVYDNIGECYETDGLYDVAMEAYRKAYQILKGDCEQIYPLRGIARVFWFQHKKDSALYYYQQALDYALIERDSTLIGATYNDIALVYCQEEEYNLADKYVSKAIEVMNQEMLAEVYLLKAEIMFNLNKIDSADYYFNENVDQYDIYGKATYYDGLHKIALKKGEWRVANEYLDKYITLYDSIQIMNNNKELSRLMDKHKLEEHKRLLSEKSRKIIITTFILSMALIFASVFWFMLVDRKRKKRIIDLQQKLNQKRVDVALLRDEASEINNEDVERRNIELIEEQIHLCKLMFQPTHCCERLDSIKTATPKQLLDMDYLRKEIKDGVWKYFVDVMNSLDEGGAKLTSEDQYFCILILLNCDKTVIMELMEASSDALKTRKNRIKKKMLPYLFHFVFDSDNQYNSKK